MPTRREQLVIVVIGTGQGTVREHIAIKVVACRITVEDNQSVVGVVTEATIGSIGQVARFIVGEGLGRNNRVIAEDLDRSRRDPTKVIISIAHFGRICNRPIKKQPPRRGAEKMKTACTVKMQAEQVFDI